MSNETNKAQDNQIDEQVESIIEGELLNEGSGEASLMDELTQANFRVEELEKSLQEAQSTVDSQKDSVIRAAAEVDNIRRRAAIDVEKARKFALEKFANELLPVLDNMERALQGTDAEAEATKAIYEGVELTAKSFVNAVEKFGLTQVDPQGDTFNPELHQAIGMQPSTDFPANTVMMVMQKGYTLNERLLRPAMVMVSQG
ncbi:nucleotide exchange factor GrpE [Shewanella sp. Choline-02u-19]|uniref:nucleotide exchange factor GrpE n=1 Tax=unclassified Shewanella TaxID=196818 RepID=UPI000C327E32|nr:MULTISPECIES: nucleotide exchange factor GrpE [unclassified Shewanella]PKG58291.1 nucleotide exchange factor GrpE [Shewanella sp. GutDb-MelDb]PKG75050.1 nucleotide exchange factor GrpE [Shewanella sp. GutCb]PKH54859.1 nucleotide exchange factor GrpE [Shewanella sp. Bg11-22]PKI26631.1 nucleotide exchange factor GrpE [Shewanella sp. Choline-02u-19]